MNILALFSSRKTTPSVPISESSSAPDEERKSRSLLDFLSRYYVWILGLAAIVIVAEQIREHLADAPGGSETYYVFYGEIFAVFLLLGLIGLLIRVLLTTLAEKTRALTILNVKHDFTQQLSTSQDIPEVSKSLVRQIATIVPTAMIELYIHEQAKDWFIRVNREGDDAVDNHHEELPASMSSYPCRECLLKNSQSLHPLNACSRDDGCLQVEDQAGYCLPLVYGDAPVGLLLLYSPAGQRVSAEQSDLLEHLSGEMAQAIGMLIEKKTREEARLTEKIHTIQLDIARDLHDTVGQNISFLRMKLDHLSETEGKGQADLIMEIRSMSKVANESYDLVRGTLAVLQADDSADLLYLFSRYAEQVAERSEFGIDFATQGTARSISASRIRHLFYIFREALNNIEKHAHASQVHVNINWLEDRLDLQISDNGRGYDPSRTQKIDIHYGLKFMRERATLLNGTLAIHSTLGAGTTINVLIPCE